MKENIMYFLEVLTDEMINKILDAEQAAGDMNETDKAKAELIIGSMRDQVKEIRQCIYWLNSQVTE